jgi:hypothetical protein
MQHGVRGGPIFITVVGFASGGSVFCEVGSVSIFYVIYVSFRLRTPTKVRVTRQEFLTLALDYGDVLRFQAT